jgi:uncharacterized protein YidB (DUF937 family)
MSLSPLSGVDGIYPPSPMMQRTPPPMTSTAQLLGISPDELQKDMQSGTTLAQLAAQSGVSKDDLVKSIVTDLKANAPQGAPAIPDAQLTQMATNIADGKRPHGGHHHHHTEATSAAGDSSQSNLSSLADALGIDPSTLLAQINSGQDIGPLLSGTGNGGAPASAQGTTTLGYGSNGNGSSVADLLDGGVAVDKYA